MESIYAYNYGLKTGKMNTIIVDFILSRLNKNKELAKYAEEQLNEIGEKLIEIDEINFANGIAGIGFGIEWLSQYNFINVNTDEILEDIDDELYKSVVFTKTSDLSLDYGALGQAVYFYKRLKSQNPDSNRLKKICLNQCLILLFNRLYENSVYEIDNILFHKPNQISTNQIKQIAYLLIFSKNLFEEQIETKKAINLIRHIFSFASKVIEMGLNKNICFYDLIYACSVTSDKLGLSRQKKEAKKNYINLIKSNKPTIDDEYSYYIHGKLTKLHHIKFLSPNNIYNDLRLVDIINNFSLGKKWAEIYLLE